MCGPKTPVDAWPENPGPRVLRKFHSVWSENPSRHVVRKPIHVWPENSGPCVVRKPHPCGPKTRRLRSTTCCPRRSGPETQPQRPWPYLLLARPELAASPEPVERVECVEWAE